MQQETISVIKKTKILKTRDLPKMEKQAKTTVNDEILREIIPTIHQTWKNIWKQVWTNDLQR